MNTKFWLENLKGRDNLGDLGINKGKGGNRIWECGLDSYDSE